MSSGYEYFDFAIELFGYSYEDDPFEILGFIVIVVKEKLIRLSF